MISTFHDSRIEKQPVFINKEEEETKKLMMFMINELLHPLQIKILYHYLYKIRLVCFQDSLIVLVLFIGGAKSAEMHPKDDELCNQI